MNMVAARTEPVIVLVTMKTSPAVAGWKDITLRQRSALSGILLEVYE